MAALQNNPYPAQPGYPVQQQQRRQSGSVNGSNGMNGSFEPNLMQNGGGVYNNVHAGAATDPRALSLQQHTLQQQSLQQQQMWMLQQM